MKRVMGRLRRPLSFLLLPLSAVPLVAIVPLVSAAHKNFQREHGSGPLAAPALVLSAAQQARWQPVPRYDDAVPVLAYHGVSDTGGHGEVTRRTFALQMAMLRQMGYETISTADYASWRRGAGELPSRPILVTFDGGELDTYRGADAILRRNHQRATIFVASGGIGVGDPALLTWRELKHMAASGRWDVQSAGHDVRGTVVTDPNGTVAPFYAARRFTTSSGYETLADFERRVTSDVFAAKDDLERQGLPVTAIALPGGDQGPDAIADASMAALVRGLLERQFDVVFVRPRAVPGYTTQAGPAERYEVAASTTAEALRAWLRAGSPAALEHRARQVARQVREHGRSPRIRATEGAPPAGKVG